MRIRNSIRLLRAHKGDMTQQALADLVGITRQTVIAMEQDRYSPSLETAFRIAEALGARDRLEQGHRALGLEHQRHLDCACHADRLCTYTRTRLRADR